MVSARKKRLPSLEDEPDSAPTLKTKPSSTPSQRKQAKRKKAFEPAATESAAPIASPSARARQLEAVVQAGKSTAESNDLEKDSITRRDSVEEEPEPEVAAESEAEADVEAEGAAEAEAQARTEAEVETEAGPGARATAEADTAEEMEERDARERMFGEFTEEYYDIVEELPLELDRNFTLIGELEASVEECKQELREDLREYLNFAKRTIDESSSAPLSTQILIEDQDLENQLLVLAQPLLWGNVPLIANAPPPPSSIPDHLKSLLSEISKKMSRLHKLSRDKLNLAETVYEGLDRHLKRLDTDLEKYQDLEDEDEDAERRQEREDQAHEQGLLNSQSTDLESRSPRKMCSPQPEERSESVEAASNAAPNPMKRSVNKPHPRHPGPAVQSSPQAGPISTPSSQLVSFQLDADAPLAHSDATSPRIASSRTAEPTQPKAPRTPRLGSLATQSASGLVAPNWPDKAEHTAHSPTPLVPGPQISPETGSSSRPLKARRPTCTTTPSSRRVGSGSRKKLDIEASIGPVIPIDGKNSQGDEEKLYCYCKQVSYGDMVGCDNVDCEGGEWFHLECTGLQQLPNAVDWYCELCVKKLNGNEGVVKKRKR